MKLKNTTRKADIDLGGGFVLPKGGKAIDVPAQIVNHPYTQVRLGKGHIVPVDDKPEPEPITPTPDAPVEDETAKA